MLKQVQKAAKASYRFPSFPRERRAGRHWLYPQIQLPPYERKTEPQAGDATHGSGPAGSTLCTGSYILYVFQVSVFLGRAESAFCGGCSKNQNGAIESCTPRLLRRHPYNPTLHQMVVPPLLWGKARPPERGAWVLLAACHGTKYVNNTDLRSSFYFFVFLVIREDILHSIIMMTS